ncbi:MAG: transcription elongation factor GreA [Dehalococcoidia bacterium]|nr:transcription elongation factor GreA [Dehalococcoidia bacterium]
MSEQPLKTLRDIAIEYLDSLKPPKVSPVERANAQKEIDRFVRFFGGDIRLDSLRPADIETYAEDVLKTASGAANKLQPVRSLLSFAKQRDYVKENLGAHVRIRRAVAARKGAKAVHETHQILMTPEGFENLRRQLNEALALRPIIAQEIAAARADGDLRENAPYHMARDRQAENEARIREMEAQLKYAVIVQTSETERAERVTLGKTVYVFDLDEEEEVKFQIVSPNEVNVRAGKISLQSPTGKALVDRQVGDEVEVNAPAGAVRYRIIKIE